MFPNFKKKAENKSQLMMHKIRRGFILYLLNETNHKFERGFKYFIICLMMIFIAVVCASCHVQIKEQNVRFERLYIQN